MKWVIETLNKTVDEELLSLPADMQSKFLWISQLIEEHGLNNVGMPYVRHIQNNLWEIRMKGKDGIARGLYITSKPKRIIVVNVFIKKTQRTPIKEIKLALKRAQEIQDD